jgi:hypothetical protein
MCAETYLIGDEQQQLLLDDFISHPRAHHSFFPFLSLSIGGNFINWNFLTGVACCVRKSTTQKIHGWMNTWVSWMNT